MIAKPKKKKAESISKIRDKIDKVFNEYIRIRDGACVICGSTENLQCSHYWGKKARPAVRWDELNAHAMCAKCHFLHHHGNEAMYADFMYNKYGLAVVEGLKFVSTYSSKWTRSDLDEKLKKWTEKRNALK